jgi:phosphoribosylformylglycinamidine cyclo-ligase
MTVDDLAVTGARPLGLVDYMAVGSLDAERDAIIVASIVEACLLAGCPLLGGETAEHPGVMGRDQVDLAAAAMGVVDADGVLGPDRVRIGDLVVGLRSPNLRSNGFSLIRSLFAGDIEEHAETLLEPSVIYSPAVLAVVAAAGGVHSAAHVTGGGIIANLRRSIPPSLGARIETAAWEPPEVFHLVADRGVGTDEMFATFNMGIGFCLVVDPAAVQGVFTGLETHHPVVIGEVDGEGVVSLA